MACDGRCLVVVGFPGDLDVTTIDGLDARLGSLPGRAFAVLDLGETSFVDSASFAAILRASRRLHAGGGVLVLAAARSALVRRALLVTAFDRELAYLDTVDAAVEVCLTGVDDARSTT